MSTEPTRALAAADMRRLAGTADPATLPHHDTRCGARWSGYSTSHCRGCHRTFTAVGPFDAHRVKGVCKDPAELGMVLADGRAYEAWRLPDREEPTNDH
jgi:hypothetical protein